MHHNAIRDRYTLTVGSQVLELSHHGVAHEPGNIFIQAPAQKTLMVVDIIAPGWMPWRRLSLAEDIPGYFAQVEEIKQLKFNTLVSGHVARSGTKADVILQSDFMNDLKSAAAHALSTTQVGEGMNDQDKTNPWALFDNYTGRGRPGSLARASSRLVSSCAMMIGFPPRLLAPPMWSMCEWLYTRWVMGFWVTSAIAWRM